VSLGRRNRIWIGGAVTLLALTALLVVLLVRPFGGSGAKQVAPVRERRALPASAPAAKPKRVKPKPGRSETKPTVAERARPTNRAPALPSTGSHWIPWHDDGTSLVADSRSSWLAVYGRPHAKRPTLLLHNPDRIGSPRMLLVHTQRRDWVRVYLPNRPDGRTGWVRARAVRLLTNRYRIVVHLRRHRLQLFQGEHVVLRAKTVVGKPSTPTPKGLYYIVDLLRPPDPNGAYGPFAFNLSAHSRVLRTFGGGDGVVAIHGTNEPSLIGRSASHGCIRVRNAIIRRLARALPLGTPVMIRG
jgi:lipoprotein-anchoring transpeptidase ErfK/SrfK